MTTISIRRPCTTLLAFAVLGSFACTDDGPTIPTYTPYTGPAMQVVLPYGSVTLKQGLSFPVNVLVSRNFSGAVTLTLDSLSDGLTASTLTLAAGQSTGDITLTAASTAPTGVHAVYVRADATNAPTRLMKMLVAVQTR